jgi:hypothetical protein
VVAAVILIAVLALVVVGFVGTIQFLSAPWDAFGGVTDIVARLLGGIGLIAAATSGGAFLLISLDAAARSLGRYARLHYRLLQRTDVNGQQP